MKRGQLILCRKVGETIIIGTGEDAIEITVTEITRGQVRLGTKAKKSVLVKRGELVVQDRELKESQP